MWLWSVIYLFLLTRVFECNATNLKNKLQRKLRNLDTPNVFEGHVLWHDYIFDTGTQNREELIINNVNSINDFDFGNDVTEWKSINLKNKSYIVGLQSSHIIILTATLNEARNNFLISEKVIPINFDISAFTIFQTWNEKKNTIDVILIVAISEEDNFDMIWYRITEESLLEKIWFWHLHKKVSHLKVFKIENKPKLLIINEEQTNSNQTAADIYDFVLHTNKPDFWLYQTIPLDCSAKSASINEYGPNIYLSVPQNILHTVQIYEYSEKSFKPYQNIASSNVAHISNFNIGPKSFLAIGGHDSSIYRFTKTGLKKEIIDINLSEVKYFLPIPVNTYREDVMVLVQHDLDHSTHSSNEVRVLLYSNGVFNVHDEIPCQAFGENTHGVTCLVDHEWDHGIFGTDVLSIGDILGVIVPRKNMHSGLFMIDTNLVEVKHPMVQKMEVFMENKKLLQQMFIEQEERLTKIKQVLQNRISINNNENIVKAPFRISLFPNEDVKRQATIIKNDDFATSEFREKLKNIHTDINEMKQKILEARSSILKNKNFTNLIFNGSVEVTGKTNVQNLKVTNLNGENLDEMLVDCVRRSSGKNYKIVGKKIFSNGTIKNVTFATLNNKNASRIAYSEGSPIHIKGNLIFNNVLTVMKNVNVPENGTINGIKFDNEIVEMNSEKSFGNLQFERVKVKKANVKMLNGINMTDIFENHSALRSAFDDVGLNINVDNLYMPKTSFTVKNVNGEPFNELIRKIYLKDAKKSYFFSGNTTVLGNVYVRGNADIKTLNSVKYPEEYLMQNTDRQFISITGQKTFIGKLSAAEVVVNGLVDEVDPNTILTLTFDQKIPGNFTFTDLELTESLNVNGSIITPFGVEIFMNPTLEETHKVTSDMNFKSLEVFGTISVNNINEQTIETLLGDVVYKGDENIVIQVPKQIENVFVQQKLQIASNKINEINLDTLLTSNTKQDIFFEVIKGNITIKNLELHGLLDSMDMTKEIAGIVKLDEEAFIESEIIFDNTDEFVDIYANFLNIGTLNEQLNLIQNIEITDEMFLDHDTYFENLKADEVFIERNFDGAIDGFDLKYYDEHRLSLTKDQTVSAEYNVDEGDVDVIETRTEDGLTFGLIKPYVNVHENMMDKLYTGNLYIDELQITGSLEILNLNGNNVNELFSNVFWLNKNNNISTDITFNGNVEFEDLSTTYLNEVHFNSFIEDLVKTDEKVITLNGEKIFQEGFETKELFTYFVNQHNFEELFLMSKDHEIFGNVTINGNLWIEDNLMTSTLNDVNLTYIYDTFSSNEYYYIINGDVEFDKHVYIENLYINGLLNNKEIKDYFENIVQISKNFELPGDIIFKNEVLVEKNLHVQTTINDMEFDKLMEQVVLTTQDDFLAGDVTFTEDVNITDNLLLENNLYSKYICECEIQRWKDIAVYLDDGYIAGNLTFESVTIPANSELIVDYVNGVDMNRLIPLYIDQTIDQSLVFNSIIVENDISVGNLVNGYNLEQEFDNTVMRDYEQIIESSVIFTGPVTINKALKTSGLTNGKNLSLIVTTDTDQNLTASYIFDAYITFDSNIYVNGLVNDINIADWDARVITAYGEEVQVISNPIVVDGKVTFMSGVSGFGLLGGWNITSVAEAVRFKLHKKYEIEINLKNEYEEMCYKVLEHVNRAKNQIYKFKYLETHQYIELYDKIRSIHTLKYNYNNFLIVSEIENCKSKIYEWFDNKYNFLYEASTGEVEQFITIYEGDKVYLITKNNEVGNCEKTGINFWLFNDAVLTHMQKLQNADILQQSKLPGIFYTLSKNTVTEYRIFTDEYETIIHAYRKWIIPESNYTFNPHERTLGLSIRNADHILKLLRKEVKYSKPDYNAVAIEGDVYEISNNYLPHERDGEVLVMKVGMPDERRKLVAVARHEITSVNGVFDFIKIYEDISSGKLFHKVATYKPSCLNKINFGDNGETLLVFMEDKKTLQVYEYKGMDGFQKRSSARIEASQIITVSLPLKPYRRARKFLILVNENVITILEAVMDGDRSDINFNCDV